MVKNVYVKFNYDRMSIDKALGNWKSDDNNENNRKNVRSRWLSSAIFQYREFQNGPLYITKSIGK